MLPEASSKQHASASPEQWQDWQFSMGELGNQVVRRTAMTVSDQINAISFASTSRGLTERDHCYALTANLDIRRGILKNWSEREDLNLRPPVPQTAGPDIRH
jgi:hypothetical protein